MIKDATDGIMLLDFSNPINSDHCISNVPLRIFTIGDLKFAFQLTGREGYSTKWHLWCNLSPAQWKVDRAEQPAVSVAAKQWSIQLL